MNTYLGYLMMKCLILFLIFLQTRIYESQGFQHFQRETLKQIIDIANNFKSLIISYKFNNQKLIKIIKRQIKRKKMFENASELRG